MLRFLSFEKVILGIEPERELFWRFNLVRRVKFWMDSGIFPVNELNERSSTFMWGGNVAGMSPLNLLC